MKYLIIFLSFTFFYNTALFAQGKPHKIVFDVAIADTADQSTLIRQVNNILSVSPASKIELVFHGKALYALVAATTPFKEKLDALVNGKKVVIAACANSMKRLQINKEDLISVATVVPVAMIELAEKQENGWSYIKSGR